MKNVVKFNTTRESKLDSGGENDGILRRTNSKCGRFTVLKTSLLSVGKFFKSGSLQK